MKSFKQKIEEKQKRLAQERIEAEKQRLIELEKEQSKLLEKEIKDETESNAKLLAEEEVRKWKEYQKNRKANKIPDTPSISLEEKIENYRTDQENKKLFRSNQKDSIKEILENESDIRNKIQDEYVQSDIELFEAKQLERLEEEERLFKQQEEERLKQAAIESAEQKLLEEKLKRYKQSEQEEREEKERMRLLREEQEKEKRDKKAIRIQEAISSRKIYELRQKKIAKQEKAQRDAINEILAEAFELLNSKESSSRKTQLQKIHDYIYRLDSSKDKWTNRKQPKSVLTWTEWKSVPDNAKLVDEDFRRARLLFEQDNKRANLYHTSIWQNMIPSRNLTLDRKKKLSADNKLTDINHKKTVSFLEEIVADMDGINCWLDAAAGPKYLDRLVTESILSNTETASLSATWVPTTRTGNNNRSTVTLSQMVDQLNNGSDNLILENPENLWDSAADTYMTIRHTSASASDPEDLYDWRSRQKYGDNAINQGIVDIRIILPKDVNNEYHKIERVEVFATDRKYIPEYMSLWYNNNGGDGFPENFARNYIASTITSSISGQYSSTLRSLKNEGEHTGNGGRHGITAEGSASLDPYIFAPRKIAPVRYNSGQFDEVLLSIHRCAHPTEIRINQIKFHYHKNVSGSVTNNGDQVQVWRSKPGKSVTSASMHWERGAGNDVYSREYPYNNVTRQPLRWFTGSSNDPSTTIDGKIDMPFIRFSSESLDCLTCNGEFLKADQEGITQFFVLRGYNGDYNQNRVFFSDFGATAKTAYTILQTGFTQAATVQIYDFDKQGTAATTKHVINAGENTGQSEFTLDGIRRDSATSSLWPYVGSEFGKEHLSCTPSRLMARTNRRASSFTVQLDNKVNGTFDTGSSRARLWLDGGTPFVDLDASVAAPYNFTGSNEAPTLGSQTGIYQWAGVMHEMIIFDRVLSTTEIDTVHKYLNTKWRLGFMEDTKSDKNGQFVYGVSSSNSSQDTWTYDATDAGFPGDTSAWELG